MNLNLLPEIDHLIHLECEGDMTLATVPTDANPLTQLLGPACYSRKVLLSLEKTRYLDTVGVGCLVKNHKHFEDEGGRIVLHSLPPEAEHLLRLLRLDTILHLAIDEPAARQIAQFGEVDHARHS